MGQPKHRTAVLSSETLALIAQKASEIHHGSVLIEINADRPDFVTVEAISRERCETVSHHG
jgi:hypothetical protein